MQIKPMCIDATIDLYKIMMTFLKNYRNEGYVLNIDNVKVVASDMNVEPIFPKKHQIIRKKKRQFDETINKNESQSLEESFRIEYFLFVFYLTIALLKRRFER